MHVTPSTLIHRHFGSLLSNLEGALDGDVESVHQARVATRRLREVLPLVEGDRRAIDAVRSAGRHLGGVRELDVMSALLDSFGSRIPTTAAADLHRATQAIRIHRLEARRTMVKALERLDLYAVRDAVSDVVPRGKGWRRMLRPGAANRDWKRLIRELVASRSRRAVGRVRRTRAVYLPNRAHRARVAIKKLRYALEAAADTGLVRAERTLKDLRRSQAALGEVHDLQVLADTLGTLLTSQHGAVEPSPLRALVDDDLARRYADFFKRRDRILQLAVVAPTPSRHWPVPVSLVAASVITAPVIVQSIRSWRARPAVAPERNVEGMRTADA